MPWRTKLNPQEIILRKNTILTTFVRDTGQLDLCTELIQPLQWVTLDESVFVLIQN